MASGKGPGTARVSAKLRLFDFCFSMLWVFENTLNSKNTSNCLLKSIHDYDRLYKTPTKPYSFNDE